MSDKKQKKAKKAEAVKETLELDMKMKIVRAAAATTRIPDDAARLLFVEMVLASMSYTNSDGERFLRYKLGARRLAGVLQGRTDQQNTEVAELIDPVLKTLQDAGWIELMRPGRKQDHRGRGEFASWRLNLNPGRPETRKG